MEIKFDDIICEKAPQVMLLVGEAEASDSPTTDALWHEIETVSARIHDSYEMPMINKRPGIAATRAAYKACGKDPNRYRPSCEAMCRRLVKGDNLYRTSTLVDIGNLASIASGYSLGIFDRDKIEGDTLTLGVGRQGEPYEAIHRGELNIAGMPVLRDAVGGIADQLHVVFRGHDPLQHLAKVDICVCCKNASFGFHNSSPPIMRYTEYAVF